MAMFGTSGTATELKYSRFLCMLHQNGRSSNWQSIWQSIWASYGRHIGGRGGMNLKEYLSKEKPNLSASSITTYNSILTNLYKKVFNDGTIDMDLKKQNLF